MELISLSNDSIFEILSWLPAKDVLVCKCVCRNWMDLTSNKGFTDLHSRRALPMILQDFRGGVYLLDGCWEFATTKAKIHKVMQPYYDYNDKFSHNGLIVSQRAPYSYDSFVFFSNETIIICNPIYHETVYIIVPQKQPKCVYGVFFHPVQEEHCTLWRMTLSRKPLKVQYMILNLESNPHWKLIKKNPSTQNARIWGISPILIFESLYWMIEPLENCDRTNDSTFNCDIMKYDVRNESFRVIPCPVPVTVKQYHYNVNLVELDGVLSLIQVFPSKELVEINIWTLKDEEEVLWTSSQYIISTNVYLGEDVPKAVAFRNEELVLETDGRLHVFNLKLGTFRKFGQQNNKELKFSPHITSLVSLRNCRPKICMTEEDEKILRECSRPDEIQAIR